MTADDFDIVEIPGGAALLGTARAIIAEDAEGPLVKKRVKPYRIGRTTVTNAEFAAFIDATGYITEAEHFGWSFVFWLHVPDEFGPTEGVREVEWWRRVDGANWRDVNGPGTQKSHWKEDHPVVHVSWNDAKTYAGWAGGRLPSELE